MAKVVKDAKVRREQKQRRSGMIISLLLMFLFLLLTSSFVLRYVYQGASNVTITQEGVSDVFRAAIGDTAYTKNESAPFEEDTTYNYYDSTDTYNYDETNSDQRLYTDGSGIYNDQQQYFQEDTTTPTDQEENIIIIN